MKIILDIDNQTKSPLPKKEDLKKTIFNVLKEKGVDINTEIGLKIVDKSTIQKINKKYRKLNKPTDVLSFPVYKNPPKKSEKLILLGDIFICKEEASQSFESLLIHGVKHLLGYHHR